MSSITNPATSGSIANALSSSSSSSSPAASKNGLEDLNINQFLQLMISELSHQDPLNPMDNTQLVQQMGELRSIAASDQLSSTLQSLQTQQSMTTASSLIGKQVTALGADGQDITGTVTSVKVDVDPTDNTKRTYQVTVGDQSIDLQNVREVD